MKVTQEEKFNPITVILETQEEADTLWHLMNVPIGSYKEYCGKEGVNLDEFDKRIQEMWHKYHPVYKKLEK